MKRVNFGDIVREVKVQVDRNNNPYIHYVAGDHMDSMDLTIRRKGSFATDDVGPAFIRIFKPGQVLYGSRRTYLKKIAVADFEGICSNTTFVLETKDSNVFLQELLPFVMLSESFTKWSISHSKGSTNPYVLFSDLANYEFTLPSLSEQKVLADKLWAAYRVKESYKKLLAATDDMLKAKFQEMKNAASQIVPLSEICIVQKGSNLTRNNAIDGIYPVIAGGQIPSCYHNTYNREGHVISVSASGAYAGFVNYWKNPIYASDCNTIISKSGDISETYFVYLGLKAMQNEVYKLQKGGAQPHVYGSDLELFSFPIIEKNFQQQFVEIATQAEATKESLRKSIENIDQVIKSLINQ